MIRFVAAVIWLSVALTGCGSHTAVALNEGDIAGFAHDATEACLKGLSQCDLAMYVEYGNEEFKAAVTQEMLDKTCAQISGSLGAYESKEFRRAEEQEGYIIVHYKATYERGLVGVRMVFDTDHLIAGQWFE